MVPGDRVVVIRCRRDRAAMESAADVGNRWRGRDGDGDSDRCAGQRNVEHNDGQQGRQGSVRGGVSVHRASVTPVRTMPLSGRFQTSKQP